jgi:enterochelin esterase family protein
VGRANLILDNLIAAGSAKPMMVVMPYGRPLPEVMLVPSAGRGPANADDLFGKDLLEDVIPYVEKLYRTTAKAEDRALAGLSMGGGQALRIGLGHLDTFHYIGAFSAAARGNPEETFKDFFADPAAANRKLKLFYIACGKEDGLFAGAQALSDALEKHQIKHRFAPSGEGHVWRNWRDGGRAVRTAGAGACGLPPRQPILSAKPAQLALARVTETGWLPSVRDW